MPASSVERSRAHPRVGGEDATSARTAEIQVGSPPRRRGRPRVGSVGDGGVGAHPRVGGEDTTEAFSFVTALGSPPRRRGRLLNAHYPGAPVGLTPA